jgi:dihydrofolate reductase
MGKIVVFMSLTLDGVMQAPGRPDEDRRGGFEHGGWAIPYADSISGGMAGEGMAKTGGILLGRRTYEDFYAVWAKQTDNPFTTALNGTQKYVASTTLKEPLAWMNSTLLKGEAADAVARLKEEMDKDLVVLGSGELVRTLMRRGLIDEYILLIHPLILGTGRRLFPEDNPLAALRLADTRPTTTGVVIATYQVIEQAAEKTEQIRGEDGNLAQANRL